MSQSPSEKDTQLVARPPQNVKPLQLSRTASAITDEQAWELATRIKNSNIIPKDFIGKPENIFIAILMGREVGLPAIQAVQNIMVVNGRPCMWGDALPALVYASDKVEKFEEEIDPEGKWAKCSVRRKGDTKDHVQTFTWADAQKAGYDKKQGPWQTTPKRMMQMRARAFALRDKFADVLKGLGMVEEAQDYEILDGNAAPAISMPKEVVDVQEKAEAFKSQEATVVESSGAGQPQPSTTPSNPLAEAGDIKNPERKEDPRIVTAKKKFQETYQVAPETIDRWLAWHKATEFAEAYPKLQELWKDLKGGKFTVESELGRFAPKEQPAQPATDEDLFQ